jgi:hypothetical protein
MALQDLFLGESQHQEAAMTKLPQDMDLWAETIVSKIRERLPGAKDLTISINFSKENEEMGTATGSAKLLNQKLNKSVHVPLIVKNFSLYPMDVMLIPNDNAEGEFEAVPLNKDYYLEALFNPHTFHELGDPVDRLRQLYGGYSQGRLIFPPTFRNVYASANMLNSIKDTVWSEDVTELMSTLKSSPNILVGYEKRANLDKLQLISSMKEKTAASKKKLQNVSVIKKDLHNKYKLYTSSDEAYAPIVEGITRQELKDTLHGNVEHVEDTLHEVDRNGEYMVFSKLNPVEPIVTHPGEHQYQSVTERATEPKIFGVYKIQDKNRVYHTGVVIPNIINFDNTIQRGEKVFLSPNKCAFQGKMSGTSVDDKKACKLLHKMEPQIGMTGVLVAHSETNAVATVPFTIRSMMKVNGTYNIVAMDLNGRKLKIKMESGDGCYGPAEVMSMNDAKKSVADFHTMDQIKKIVKVKDVYLIPTNFKFVPMDNFAEMAEVPQSVWNKLASVGGSPVRVIHTGANQFSLKGPQLDKMASAVGWDYTNLSPSQAVFLLAAKKCPLDKIAHAMTKAGELGESQIHGLPTMAFGQTEATEQQIKFASAWVNDVRALRVNLVKEASQLEDSSLVDTALSLNFINPENINKFVNFIPAFENAIKALAQTLMASRLGMTEIPEQSTATAMHKLVEVVKGLKRLAVHLENN